MKCSNCGAPLVLQDGQYYCPYCQSIHVRKEEILCSDDVSDCFDVRCGVLVAYTGKQRNVVIPSGIVSIGKGVFKGNIGLESVVFSNSVVFLEDNAFDGCINLNRIENFDNITSFGNEAFKGAGLSSIAIKGNVKQIGKNCFSQMPNLKKVVYKPGKDLRLHNAFARCPNLSEVEMDQKYFFPSLHDFCDVRNNPSNKRPTLGDAFRGTPFLKKIFAEYMDSYKRGICVECGGTIKKGLFHKKCLNCNIDYAN